MAIIDQAKKKDDIVLTASEDSLRYDPLKDTEMKGYDPLSPIASKRVGIMDKELGFALHPEQKQAVNDFRTNVDNAVKDQQKAVNDYRVNFTQAMKEADQKAKDILAKYEFISPQKKVPVNVVSQDGQIEYTYYVNKDWADEQIGNIGGVDIGNGQYNVPVTYMGRVQGKEIHETMIQAQLKTADVDEYLAGMNMAVGTSRAATEKEIASQRKIANDKFKQNISQANQVIQRTKGMWTKFLTTQRTKFQEGIKTNTGGIKDLLDSGALVFKGTVK